MVVSVDKLNMPNTTDSKDQIQENREKITDALEQAGITAQIADLTPELTKNAQVVLVSSGVRSAI